MNFKNNLDGWRRHSCHVQLNNNCRGFSQNKYSRVWSNTGKTSKNGGGGSVDVDVNRNKKQSAKPGRREEHCIIAEFLKVNQICIEIPNRKYCQKQVYEDMKKIKTKFGNQEAEQRSRWMDKAISKGEKQLSTTVEKLFQTDGSMMTSNDAQNEINLFQMDFELIGFSTNPNADTDSEGECDTDTKTRVPCH